MKTIQSIDRVAMILEYVSKNQNCRLIDISKALEIKNTTLHALIGTLEYWGYINKNSNNQYTLGYKLFELGKLYESTLTLKDICHPYMNALVESYGETSHLAVLTKNKIQYIHKVESTHALRLTSKVGCIDELHHTASGKAMLANFDIETKQSLLSEAEFLPLTESTIIDQNKLNEELELTKKRGYALDLEEYEIGLNCIAVPIFSKENKPIASISVSMPCTRFNKNPIDNIINDLICYCNEISSKLKTL